MKKYVISFTTFCVAFALALGLLYTQANPADVKLSSNEPIEWTGYVENSYGTYSGSLLSDAFAGTGKFSFLSGEIYTGNWKDTYMSGEGSIEFPGIGSYVGEFSESKRSGHGVFTWNTGEKYEGNWANDKMTGAGTYYLNNSCSFTGTFNNNKPVSGTLVYTPTLDSSSDKTEITYFKYTYAENANENAIEYKTIGGFDFTGKVENNKPVSGTLTYSPTLGSGSDKAEITNLKYTYSANTNENTIEYKTAGGLVFIGEVRNNRPVSGTLVYTPTLDSSSDKTEISYLKHIYSENASEDTLEFKTVDGLDFSGSALAITNSGSATVTYPSGNTYTGMMQQGKRQGTGTYTWKSKSGNIDAIYTGAWEADKMNGVGTYHYSSSEYPYLTGTFENGKPKGTLVYYKEAGNAFETKWVNGKCKKVKEI